MNALRMTRNSTTKSREQWGCVYERFQTLFLHSSAYVLSCQYLWVAIVFVPWCVCMYVCVCVTGIYVLRVVIIILAFYVTQIFFINCAVAKLWRSTDQEHSEIAGSNPSPRERGVG